MIRSYHSHHVLALWHPIHIFCINNQLLILRSTSSSVRANKISYLHFLVYPTLICWCSGFWVFSFKKQTIRLQTFMVHLGTEKRTVLWLWPYSSIFLCFSLCSPCSSPPFCMSVCVFGWACPSVFPRLIELYTSDSSPLITIHHHQYRTLFHSSINLQIDLPISVVVALVAQLFK